MADSKSTLRRRHIQNKGRYGDYLSADDLKVGYVYRIQARNALCGIWLGEEGGFGFAISRTKFSDNFIFVEYHWDCEAFATTKPFEEIEKSPYMPGDFKYETFICDGTEGFSWIKKGSKYTMIPKSEEILEYLNKIGAPIQEKADKEWREHLEKLKAKRIEKDIT